MNSIADTEKREGGAGHFPMEKGVLHANGDLYWERLEEFDSECKKLLAGKRGRIELDLTAVNFISSSYLGCLNKLLLEAARREKHIVLKVSQDTSWLFDILGSRKNLELEVY